MATGLILGFHRASQLEHFWSKIQSLCSAQPTISIDSNSSFSHGIDVIVAAPIVVNHPPLQMRINLSPSSKFFLPGDFLPTVTFLFTSQLFLALPSSSSSPLLSSPLSYNEGMQRSRRGIIAIPSSQSCNQDPLSLSLSLSVSYFSLHSPHPSSQLFAQLNPRLLSIPIQSSSSPSLLFLKIPIILETLFIINFSAKFLISPSSQLFTSQHHSRSRDDDSIQKQMIKCLFVCFRQQNAARGSLSGHRSRSWTLHGHQGFTISVYHYCRDLNHIINHPGYSHHI